MKNEKKQHKKVQPVATVLESTKKWSTSYEVTTLKALQEKAKLVGKTYQYGGYQGL